MKARIAITSGDPAGIGPEIARKAADDPRVRKICEPVIYGPPAGVEFNAGELSAEAGRAAYDTLCRAVKDAQAGAVAAVATAPVNKLAFARAGLPWKGHTDLLAHLTGSSRVAMMFWSEPLKVVLATVHIPLASVTTALTRELMDDIIDLTSRELPRFGIQQPRIAVAGLNPHAGEEGELGMEEIEIIAPAVEQLKAEGIQVTGPVSADSMFHPRARAEYDAALCMYHDQALIPVKTLHFDEGVNMTLGLPIVRTSPDHGTAFGIAGKWQANPGAMIAAIEVAATAAENRLTYSC